MPHSTLIMSRLSATLTRGTPNDHPNRAHNPKFITVRCNAVTFECDVCDLNWPVSETHHIRTHVAAPIQSSEVQCRPTCSWPRCNHPRSCTRLHRSSDSSRTMLCSGRTHRAGRKVEVASPLAPVLAAAAASAFHQLACCSRLHCTQQHKHTRPALRTSPSRTARRFGSRRGHHRRAPPQAVVSAVAAAGRPATPPHTRPALPASSPRSRGGSGRAPPRNPRQTAATQTLL